MILYTPDTYSTVVSVKPKLSFVWSRLRASVAFSTCYTTADIVLEIGCGTTWVDCGLDVLILCKLSYPNQSINEKKFV